MHMIMGTIVLMFGVQLGNDRSQQAPILFSMFSLFNFRILIGE